MKAIIGVLVAALALPAAAESVSAQIGVSAYVVARAVVTVESQPSTVNVTAEDVERGYVDVAEPISVHVRTNSRSGYLLQAGKGDSEFTNVALTTPTVSLNVGADESWLRRPYTAGGELLVMHARVYLAPGTTPGTHTLPLSFNASPL